MTSEMAILLTATQQTLERYRQAGCFVHTCMHMCRYDLHVLLVEHGKRCTRCASNGKPRKESHGPCPLVNIHAGAAVKEMQEEDLIQEEAKDMKPEDIVQQAVKVKEEDS